MRSDLIVQAWWSPKGDPLYFETGHYSFGQELISLSIHLDREFINISDIHQSSSIIDSGYRSNRNSLYRPKHYTRKHEK
jgi:hypothetical protein